jgi:hypothetical protein
VCPRKKKEEHLSLSSMDIAKGDQRLNSTPEVDCDQTAMGLPIQVILIVNFGKK